MGCKAGKSIKRIEIQPSPNIRKSGSKNGSRKGSKKGDPATEAAPKPAPKPAEPAPQPAPKPAEPTPASRSQQPEAQWVPGYPSGPTPQMMSVSVCCAPGYEDIPGSPCYHIGPPGPPYPYGYCGCPCPPPYYGNRCDYFSEENPDACSVM